MTAPSDETRRPSGAGLFTVMRRAGPRNVPVPSAQSRSVRVPPDRRSRSVIKNRRVLCQFACAVSIDADKSLATFAAKILSRL